jgi:hypothetical protein
VPNVASTCRVVLDVPARVVGPVLGVHVGPRRLLPLPTWCLRRVRRVSEEAVAFVVLTQLSAREHVLRTRVGSVKKASERGAR